MPKLRRAKPKTAARKPARKDSQQYELAEQSKLKASVAARREAEVAHEETLVLPPKRRGDRLWNILAGLSLVPFVWIFTAALFVAFMNVKAGAHHVPFWRSGEFQWFAIGAGAWLAITCASLLVFQQPQPVRAYVFGHEMMHMLMAWTFRGKVKDFHIGSDGGYIVTDKYNFLIALAPYLWPSFAVPVLVAWGLTTMVMGPSFLREPFLVALGVTWMFHLTFTLWVLRRRQSDFHGPGRLFSFALVYLANTILLSGTLLVFAPYVGWRAYGRALAASALGFYDGVGKAFALCGEFIGWLWQHTLGS